MIWLVIILGILALPMILLLLYVGYQAMSEGFLYLFNREGYYKRQDEDIKRLLDVLFPWYT